MDAHGTERGRLPRGVTCTAHIFAAHVHADPVLVWTALTDPSGMTAACRPRSAGRSIAAIVNRGSELTTSTLHTDSDQAPAYAQFRTPSARFPRDLKDAEVPTQAARELAAAAAALQQAFAAGDAAAEADLLHTDVVVVDMSLRAQLIGRIETARYLGCVLPGVP